jgi:hypothetical protein
MALGEVAPPQRQRREEARMGAAHEREQCRAVDAPQEHLVRAQAEKRAVFARVLGRGPGSARGQSARTLSDAAWPGVARGRIRSRVL